MILIFQVFKMRELPLIGWTLLVVQLSATIIFSLKGGSAESNYVASIDYRKREGVIRHTDRESITAKIGLNHNMFNNKLRFQFNINDSYVTNNVHGMQPI